MRNEKLAIQFMWLKPDPNNNTDNTAALIETLRYAGLVTVIRDVERDANLNSLHGHWLLRMHCPAGVDSHVWARQNVERMESFGYTVALVKDV